MSYQHTPMTPVPGTDDASITSQDLNRTKPSHLKGFRRRDLPILMPQLATTPTGAGGMYNLFNNS